MTTKGLWVILVWTGSLVGITSAGWMAGGESPQADAPGGLGRPLRGRLCLPLVYNPAKLMPTPPPLPTPSPQVTVPAQPHGLTQRVSVDSSGAQANGQSYALSISSDGRYVAFASEASNLVPGDTNDASDLFVHDRGTGGTIRVSVSSSGSQANGRSYRSSISADGRYVAFESEASNLVADDTNEAWDIFIRDRQTGQTQRVNVDSLGEQTRFGANRPSISAHGRYVAFDSMATDLVAEDTNEQDDVFLHDRETGQTSRVSVGPWGRQANGASVRAAISADGRFVAFQSAATNLVTDDTNDRHDILCHDRQTAVTTRVSVDSFGAQADGGSYTLSISADARWVAFASEAANLVSDDSNGVADVFVHDRQTGQTTRVSVTSSGDEAEGASNRPCISADGRYVTFWSEAKLVEDDTNGLADILCHDRRTGLTERVTAGLSGADPNGGSYWPAISGDGRFVAFLSDADNLVPGDTNGVKDIFVHELWSEEGTKARRGG